MTPDDRNIEGLNQKGHSCKIGNIACPRDIENQNCQFCKIHTFSPILTFEYYTEAQKYIWQSYSSVNQHFVAYRRKLMSRGHTQKMYSLFGREKSISFAKIKCKNII